MAADAATTRILARIAGPYVALIGVAVVARADGLESIVRGLAADPALVFTLALFTLLVGLLITVFHTRWATPAAVVLTALGWLTLLRGVALLAAPDLVLRFAWAALAGFPMRIAGVAALLIGLWLAYEGYGRKTTN